MNLYRATYQDRAGRIRGMTFAAADAARAAQFAENWQLPNDRLLVLKLLRPLQSQLELAA